MMIGNKIKLEEKKEQAKGQKKVEGASVEMVGMQ